MDATSQFASVSIIKTQNFSWVFFVDWFLVFFLTIMIIFFFNRFTGTLLSWLLEIFLWQSKRIRIDVQAVKFSFLGGRLFFKNLTIIDKDQTICALKGSFTWRYWLPAVRNTEYSVNLEDAGELASEINPKLPCRMLLEVDGLEIFLYNRTGSYENIIQSLNKHNKSQNTNTYEKENFETFTNSTSDTSIRVEEKSARKPSFILLKVLPISIKVNKGALVAGNKNTQAILVGSFSGADGILDLSCANNPLDVCRHSFNITFERLKISLKPNISFEKIRNENFSLSSKRQLNPRWMRFKFLLKLLDLMGRKSDNDGIETHWKGLSRYLDAEEESVPDTSKKESEYAKYTSIVDADLCHFKYYYDAPGLVPERPPPLNLLDGLDIGNGGPPPMIGIEVQISNGTVYYGPWAERQRGSIHQWFFPRICKDAVPQPRLMSGQLRTYVAAKVHVEILDDCIIRIPTREASKNEEFSQSSTDNLDSIRPFGWFELKFNEGSTIFSELGMVASKSGYTNKLIMSFKGLELRSSVNHDILLKSNEHVVTGDFGFPLQWNGHTCWSILNESKDTDIYLIKEHIALFSDMSSDFSSGAATPYNLFRPITYEFNWKIRNYRIFLNVNDANIINNPLDFNDNIYVSFQGEELGITVHIPMDTVIRKSTTINFNLYTPQFSLMLDTPPWHTLNNFLNNKEVGRARYFQMEGSHTFYPEVGLGFVDNTNISCTGKYIALKCYGFVIRYLIGIKENYFGDFVRFQTLEEYSSEINRPAKSESDQMPDIPKEKEKKFYSRTENEKDIHFSFCVSDSCIILPANLYDCVSNMSLNFGSLDVDLRYTNYYMDLQADLSPVMGIYRTNCKKGEVIGVKPLENLERYDFLIDGLSIHGNRMFGLPPDEPAYFCKWDITPGKIHFDGNNEALEGLKSSVTKVGFGYKNLENKLLVKEHIVRDTTSFNFIVPLISVTLREAQCKNYIRLDLEAVSLKSIDFSNNRYSTRIDASIENLALTINSTDNIRTNFKLQTTLKFTKFILKRNFASERSLQDTYMVTHDGPFHRVPFFINENDRDVNFNRAYGTVVPSFSVPDGAPPFSSKTVDMLFDDLGLSPELYNDSSSSVATAEVQSCSSTTSFLQEFGPDVIPRSHAQQSQLHPPYKDYSTTLKGSSFARTTNYNDEDFTPCSEVNPLFEYDNLIINLGDVDLFATQESLQTLLLFMEKFEVKSMEAVLDDLHIAVLKMISTSLSKKPTITNINLITPNIKVMFGDKGWDFNDVPVFRDDFICLNIIDFSIALSKTHGTDNSKEQSLALHLVSISLELNKVKEEPHFYVEEVLKFHLEDLEIWTHNAMEMIVSTSLKSSNISIASEHLKWLSSYLKKFVQIVLDIKLRLQEVLNKVKKAEVELLYQVALASKTHHVEHDPAVITKPAYIIRLSRQHVRANDSWKLIIRLRHILRNLPQSWLNEYQQKFLELNFSVPDSAMQEVISVFSAWRSWEFTDIKNSYIFQYVFPYKEVEHMDRSQMFETSIENFAVRLTSLDNEDIYISISFLELSGSRPISEVHDGEVINEVGGSFMVNLKVSLIKGELSHLLMKLRDLKLSESKPPNEKFQENTSNFVSSADLFLQVTTFVDKVDINTSIGNTTVLITGENFGSSVAFAKTIDTRDLTALFKFESFEIDLLSQNSSAFKYNISQFQICGSSVGDLISGPKQGDISIESISVKLPQTTAQYVSVLESLGNDLKQIKSGISTFEKKLSSNTSKSLNEVPSFLTDLPTINFKVVTKHVYWKHDFIYPITIAGSVEMFELDLIISKTLGCFNFQYLELLSTISVYQSHEVLEFKQSDIGVFIKCFLDPEKFLGIITRLGTTSIFFPQIIDHTPFYKSAIQDAQDSITTLKAGIINFQKALGFNANSSKKKSNHLSVSNFLRRITVPSGNFNLAFQLKESTFVVDFKNIRWSYVDFVENETRKFQVKPHIEFGVESTKIIVHDHKVIPAISSILDVNLDLKIMNLEQTKNSPQSLHLESSHCRVLLTAETLLCIIELAGDLKHIKNELKGSGKIERNSELKVKSQSYLDKFKFFSVHMLCYNVCIGFLFEDNMDEYPGLIIGCEKVFTITEESIGKLSLIHAYSSTAKGKSSRTFFSSSTELLSPSRAFLPNMQISYAVRKIDGNKNIQIRVTGAELDVKFVSSSIILTEKALKAANHVETMKRQIRKYPKPIIPHEASVLDSYKLPTDVTSISCFMNFAGGVVKLYSLDDFEATDTMYSPSFELKTPAVKIVTEYFKTHTLKDHQINFEVFTFSSNNILHSSCVPVLYDILECTKKLGRSSKPKSEVKSTVTEINRDTDFLKVLSKFHIDFAVHVEKQELNLSCEPAAKVQAVVGINGIDIRINTNELDQTQPLSGIISVRGLGASLQHSYSREVSGSVQIDKLLCTFLLSCPNSLMVYVAGEIENIDAYVNLKQFQDLGLFKNLWLPKNEIPSDFSSTASVNSATSKSSSDNYPLVSKFQQVSSTNPIPWNFNFMILNIGCKIDLGQSLGVVTAGINKVWAASKKKSSWEQNMSVGLESISLNSEGRLSGHLETKGVRLHSVVLWSLAGMQLKTPLVLLSFGFKDIQVKASFDYNLFLVGRIMQSYITVFNQIDKNKVLQDKLVASTYCQSIELFITALAASNILDIYNTLSRIRQDNKKSYKEDLKTNVQTAKNKNMDIFNIIATLRAELDVKLEKLILHVYPSSLLDSQVLIVDIGGLDARFEQSFSQNKNMCSVSLHLYDMSVALSTYKKQLPEEYINRLSVEEYILHSKNAKGGSIFMFPSLQSEMETFQKPDDNLIEYRFKSSFGGKVDVRWNLGSISFIREMYATHDRALSSRLPKSKMKEGVPFYENIEDKIKDVELGTRYKYVAIEPPIIEAPQLRDLGDATPPLEWFGLHRQSFPGLTHQYAIVGLQKLVNEVETQYAKILGKA